MHFSRKGKTLTARLLLEHGADVNAQTKDGYTALMYASSRGKLKTVECLLEFQADITLKEYIDGNTACDLAREFGRNDIVKLLSKFN